MIEIKEVEELILSRVKSLNISKNDLPIFTEKDKLFSDGKFVFIDNGKFYYIVLERNKEVVLKECTDVERLTYEIIIPIISKIARKFELENREEGQDSRRIWFKKELELLEEIDHRFYEERQKEIEDILKEYPFRD